MTRCTPFIKMEDDPISMGYFNNKTLSINLHEPI